MAVAKSDPGDDAGAVEHSPGAEVPSTEIARRPVREVVRHGEAPSRVPYPIAGVRAATGVARVAWTAMTGLTAWGIGTAVGVTSTVVQRSIQGVPPREVLAEAESEVRDRLRHALGFPDAPNEPAAQAVPTLREQARRCCGCRRARTATRRTIRPSPACWPS